MGFVQQPHSMEAPPSSPLSSRPELRRSVVERSAVQRSFPGNGFCSATTLNGSAALPFVISTGAPKERSGEIWGPAVLSWKWVLFSNHTQWKHRPPLCHHDRSSEGA